MASPHPMIPVPTAIQWVLQATARLLTNEESRVESIPVHQALGRVAAKDVIMSPPGYPSYRASIVDGYAIATTAADNNDNSGRYTLATEPIHAGTTTTTTTPTIDLSLPIAHYVATGARVPDSCSCVIPVEQATLKEDGVVQLTINNNTPWIRQVGCDTPAHTPVIKAGTTIDPIDLGVLYQTGQRHVHVRALLRVGVLSTGNELVSVNDDSDNQETNGMIPDVNRPVLMALLKEYYGTCLHLIDLEKVRDDDDTAIAERVQQACQEQNCQIIITTGGVSRGEMDRMEHVLVEQLGGTLLFGRLHMKPGKPTTFVTLPLGTLVFALPGNPVSAIVCTHLLVRPCIELFLQGLEHEDTSTDENERIQRAISRARIAYTEQRIQLSWQPRLDPERPEYHRVDGNLQSTGVQRSSRLMSLQNVHGLVVLPQATAEHPVAAAGESFLLLQINDQRRVRVSDSQHLAFSNNSQLPLRVVVIMAEDTSTQHQIRQSVEQVLSGSKSGAVQVTDILIETTGDHQVATDIVVAIGPSSLTRHAEWAQTYRQHLSKNANAMALEALRGAASYDATSPLYETVVGVNDHNAIVIVVPLRGWEAALSNVRGLLKHALKTVRSGKQ